jgi:hypothetical protein
MKRTTVNTKLTNEQIDRGKRRDEELNELALKTLCIGDYVSLKSELRKELDAPQTIGIITGFRDNGDVIINGGPRQRYINVLAIKVMTPEEILLDQTSFPEEVIKITQGFIL